MPPSVGCNSRCSSRLPKNPGAAPVLPVAGPRDGTGNERPTLSLILGFLILFWRGFLAHSAHSGETIHDDFVPVPFLTVPGSHDRILRTVGATNGTRGRDHALTARLERRRPQRGRSAVPPGAARPPQSR